MVDDIWMSSTIWMSNIQQMFKITFNFWKLVDIISHIDKWREKHQIDTISNWLYHKIGHSILRILWWNIEVKPNIGIIGASWVKNWTWLGFHFQFYSMGRFDNLQMSNAFIIRWLFGYIKNGFLVLARLLSPLGYLYCFIRYETIEHKVFIL
jgi:hypothetical protein